MEHPGENNELKLWEDAGFPEQVQDPKLMRLLMKGANAGL